MLLEAGFNWLAHREPVVHQDPQLLLHSAAFQQVRPKPTLVLEFILPQVHNLAFAFAEFQTILCPSLQPLKALLKGCTALWGTGHCSQAPAPSSKLLMNKLNSAESSIESWGSPLVTGPNYSLLMIIYDHDPLGTPIHSVLIHLTAHSSCPPFLSLPMKIL